MSEQAEANKAETITIPKDMPIIANCRFGFGVKVSPHPEDGVPYIHVPEQPIEPGYNGPALRAFMESTAVAWLQQVAPHRLAWVSGY